MSEIVFQNVSKTPEINASDSGAFKLLYTPGTKNGIALDGFLSDFRAFAKITSIPESTNVYPTPTEEKPYFSEQEISQYQYQLLSASNVKNLELFTSESLEGPKSYKFSLPLINRKPHIEIDIHSSFTKNAYLQVPANFCFWGKVDNLSGTDILSFWVSAYEEGLIDISDVGMLQETFYTLTLQANTVTTFDFPDGTQGYSFKCRGDTPPSGIAWAWQQSYFTENKYDYLPPYSEESAWIFPSLNRSLYLRAESNCTLIIKIWRR